MASESIPSIRPVLPPRPSPVESVSALCVSRQKELCASQGMNESADWFCTDLTHAQHLQTCLDEISEQDSSDITKYWVNFISLWSADTLLSAEEVEEMERYVALGVPSSLRLSLYLKVLHVRHRLAHKDTFASLLSKAKSHISDRGFIEMLNIDGEMKDVLTVVYYHMNSSDIAAAKRPALYHMNSESSVSIDQDPTSYQVVPTSFVCHAALLVGLVSGLSNEKRLYILLKLNKMFCKLDKEELLYKINRSIEDVMPDFLKHLTAQGADLYNLYRQILYTFFDGLISNEQTMAMMLDYVVLEGFGILLRLIVHFFISAQDKIMALTGSALIDYIHSSEFYQLSIDWSQVLSLQPHFIQHENEYFLIHANSFGKNTTELKNLKDINDDLSIRVYEHEQQLEALLRSHRDIVQQSAELIEKHRRALQQESELQQLKEQLQSKHDDLTMKENVINTTKANKVFAQRNEELAQIVAATKGRIAENRAKLEKAVFPT